MLPVSLCTSLWNKYEDLIKISRVTITWGNMKTTHKELKGSCGISILRSQCLTGRWVFNPSDVLFQRKITTFIASSRIYQALYGYVLTLFHFNSHHNLTKLILLFLLYRLKKNVLTTRNRPGLSAKMWNS